MSMHISYAILENFLRYFSHDQINGQLRLMAFQPEELCERAIERITWHEKLEDEEAIQNRVHE